jgi:hypothetical protein
MPELDQICWGARESGKAYEQQLSELGKGEKGQQVVSKWVREGVSG